MAELQDYTNGRNNNFGSKKDDDSQEKKKRVKRSPEEILKEREERARQAKEAAQKAQSRLNETRRKKRNGELITLGVLVEVLYKAGDKTIRARWKEWAGGNLEGRNLERAQAAFSRLEGEAGPDSQAPQGNENNSR